MHSHLSDRARNSTKLSDIERTFKSFKKTKLDLKIAKRSSITLKRGYPKLDKEGRMRVLGSYKAYTANVNFTLTYDYEWRWKLAGFTFDVKPG